MNQLYCVEGISQKYDGALDYGIKMYDNLPYQRDSDICNSSTLALYSGHIIKYYLCNNEVDDFMVDNRDNQIERILQKILEQEARRNLPEQETTAPATSSSGITDEQIQTLLEDSDEDAFDENADTPAETINLDDIEDW